MYLPPQSAIKASGKPVAHFDWTDPRTGENVKVTDFGDCRGIKKIKGFNAILSAQKKEVASARKLEELKIRDLKPIAKKVMSMWRGSPRYYRPRDGEFAAFLLDQWNANGMPGEFKHFNLACRRL